MGILKLTRKERKMEESKKDYVVRGLLFLTAEVNFFYEYLNGATKVIEKMKEAGLSEGLIRQVESGVISAKKEIGILNSQLSYIEFQVKQKKENQFSPFEIPIEKVFG